MQFLDRLDISKQLAFRPKFAMTTLESSNTKIVANLLSFLLVTHMTLSDTRVTGYEFSNWTVVLKQFWTDRQPA
jgi:hypothetical protein